MPQGQAGAGPDLGLVAGRQLQHEAGRDQGPAEGREARSARRPDWRRRGRARRRPRSRSAAAAGRGRGAGAGRPTGRLTGGLRRAAAARRATRRRATSSFGRVGQVSTPVGAHEMDRVAVAAHDAALGRDVVRDDEVASLPRQLGRAHGRRPSRSPPRTRPRGRAAARRGARPSRGCRDSRRGRARAVPRPSFFIFWSAGRSTRQSATAAAKMPISAGSAASTAASISRALSTRTVLTPGGSGIATGPDTRVTSAPASAAARAMAWPCLPEERLAM